MPAQSTTATLPSSAHNLAPPHVMYEPIEETGIFGPFERYCAGGYFPAQIGYELRSSRYRIVDKLGHGSYSTTWLARDEHLAKYVAIKIGTSQSDRSAESTILTDLWEEEVCTIRSFAGVALVPDILDEFQVEGPEIQGVKWKHRCLVTTPARMSLSDAREASHKRVFQPIVARAIAAQLIQAVASLHARGIVHGDLHEGNILFRLPATIDHLTQDQLYEKYGQPALVEITRVDGLPLDPWAPPYSVVPIWLGAPCEDVPLTEARIILSDFGESFQPAIDSRAQCHTPPSLRAPETFLEPEAQLSFPAEIWSLACAIFAVLGDHGPFYTWGSTKDETLCEHVDALGRLPDEWWNMWTKRDMFYDNTARKVNKRRRNTLEDRLDCMIQQLRQKNGMAEMDGDEKQSFLTLMADMLKFRPEDRVSAQQVLESPWMLKWAKPAFESIETTPSGESLPLAI